MRAVTGSGLCLMLVSCVTAGRLMRHEAGNNTGGVCSYTFNVMTSTGETCSSGPSSTALMDIHDLISNQTAEIEQKLNTILAALSGGVGGANTENEGSTIEVTYKIWGRKECPANATEIYTGKST